MRAELSFVLLTLVVTAATVPPTPGTTAGTEEALAAADQLLEQLGVLALGAGARTLHVIERAYHPRYGGPIHAEVWRARDGRVTKMTADEVAAEVSGWRQEPYRIYHQLALRDADLRVELVDTSRLVILNRDRHTLCRFVLDAAGAPLKWGNVFGGSVNEHSYGPLAQLGAFRMPAWGTSADASWRFEYVSVASSEEPLQLPPRPGIADGTNR